MGVHESVRIRAPIGGLSEGTELGVDLVGENEQSYRVSQFVLHSPARDQPHGITWSKALKIWPLISVSATRNPRYATRYFKTGRCLSPIFQAEEKALYSP